MERGNGLYATVVLLGYGHLLGAAVFGRRRLSARLPGVLRTRLGGALLASLVATGLLLHLEVVVRWPWLMAPLLAASVWHAIENDALLAAAYRGGGLPPLARGLAGQLRPLAGSTLVASAFVCAVPDPAWQGLGLAPALGPSLRLASRAALLACGLGLARRPGLARAAGVVLVLLALVLPMDLWRWISFVEVFALWTLQHVFSWLLLTALPGGGRRRGRLLLGVHAVPAGLCGIGLMAPVSWDHPLRVALFGPSVYLFWATLHVAQTALLRGIAGTPQVRSRQ